MTMPLNLHLHTETWNYKFPFRITGRCYTDKTVVVVELSDGLRVGRGESWPVYYCDETIDSVVSDIESIAATVKKGLSRETLQQLLPAGGARNAIDCALWDLECKQQGKTIWELTGVTSNPIATAYTLGIEESPDEVAKKALKAKAYPLLKIKLDQDCPVARIEAVRAARPDARLVIDANQGWSFEQLVEVAPQLASLGVEMIEQPLPRGQDDVLKDYTAPVPLCADESCLHRGELEQAAERYQMINIKLDKAGGLTEALALARQVKAMGLEVMVGNMGGTSLAMAPGMVIAQFCRYIDLDGPLLLKYDRLSGLTYQGERIPSLDPALWG